MDDSVQRQCNEILLWRRGNGGRKPMRTRECCEEGRLAMQQAKLKGRCSKALGTKPSQRQLSQDEVRYYEWCLSDAALHQERPEWMAEVSPTRNTNSGDAHLALVPGVNPQPADARAKHPEAVDSGTSGGGANPAAKKACVAAVVISSGGPHFAATLQKTASSGVEEQRGCTTLSSPTAIKQPRTQPMKSSGVAQSAASRQNPKPGSTRLQHRGQH